MGTLRSTMCWEMMDCVATLNGLPAFIVSPVENALFSFPKSKPGRFVRDSIRITIRVAISPAFCYSLQKKGKRMYGESIQPGSSRICCVFTTPPSGKMGGILSHFHSPLYRIALILSCFSEWGPVRSTPPRAFTGDSGANLYDDHLPHGLVHGHVDSPVHHQHDTSARLAQACFADHSSRD